MRPCTARVQVVRAKVEQVDVSLRSAGRKPVERARRARACARAGCPTRRSTRVSRPVCCTPFIAVFTPGATQSSPSKAASSRPSRPAAPMPSSATTRLQCLWCLLKWDYRDPEVTATNARKHAGIRTHKSQTHRAHVPQGHPRHAPAAHVDRPLLDAAVRHAAQSRQRSPQPAARQAPRTRHRQPPRRQATTSNRRLRRPDTQRVRRPRPRPPRRPPEPHIPTSPSSATSPTSCWPDHRLILEADGRDTHDQLLARADDKARQRAPGSPTATKSSESPGAKATTQPQKLQARLRGTLKHRT